MQGNACVRGAVVSWREIRLKLESNTEIQQL
jgi:hypothetical protein